MGNDSFQETIRVMSSDENPSSNYKSSAICFKSSEYFLRIGYRKCFKLLTQNSRHIKMDPRKFVLVFCVAILAFEFVASFRKFSEKWNFWRKKVKKTSKQTKLIQIYHEWSWENDVTLWHYVLIILFPFNQFCSCFLHFFKSRVFCSKFLWNFFFFETLNEIK